jgi:hypothetical protein
MASATKLPTSSEAYFGQWSSKTAGGPTLASPISATATTFSVSDPLKNSAGTVVAGGFLMGIKKSSGWTETLWVPTGAVSADGLTFTGVVRGINPNGYDYTAGSASFADTHDADEPVFCVVTAVIPELIRSVLQGLIASGGSDFIIGTDAAGTVTLKRSTGVGTKVGFLRWYTTSGKAEYSNDGTTWVAIQDAVASVIFKVSSADTTAAYAENKIIAGTNIVITKTNTGANETLVFSTSLPAQTATHATYTPAYLTGDTGAESNFALWNDKHDCSFRATIDGTAYNFDGIDFAGDLSMADVAATIQAKMRTVTGTLLTVTWVTNHFLITSANTTVATGVSVLSTSSGTVGTDISGAGASDWMDADTGNGTATAGVLDPTADVGKVPLLGADGALDPSLLSNKQVVTVTCGENIDGSSTPQAVYISDGTNSRTAGRFYKADRDDTTNMAVRGIGFVTENCTAGGAYSVQFGGIVTGFTSLTVGVEYYLSDTAGAVVVGAIAINPSVPIGMAISTTAILLQRENRTVSATYTFSEGAGTVDTVLSVGFRVRGVIANCISGGANSTGIYHSGVGNYCNYARTLYSVGLERGGGAALHLGNTISGSTNYATTITVYAIAANTITIRRVLANTDAGTVNLLMF